MLFTLMILASIFACIWFLVATGLRRSSSIVMLSLIGIGTGATTAHAQQVEFTPSNIIDANTMILSDADGRTITVTGSPPDNNQACFAFDGTGRARAFAVDAPSANFFGTGTCDESIIINFAADGFILDELQFNDIDDFDGSSSRDSMAANVGGTWTSSTGITVHSFASPPAFADQASRLSNSGGVNQFLTRLTLDNPTNDQATFTPTNPVSNVSIIYDDAEGTRSAQGFFDLSSFVVNIAPSIDAVDDPFGSVISGTSNVGNVLDNDNLRGLTPSASDVEIDQIVVNAPSGVPSGSPLPSLSALTGIVNVPADTPAGTYTIDYRICEAGSTTVCDTATATITVTEPVFARDTSAGNSCVDGVANWGQ